ncbi:hypothetical protein MUK42_22649 [Musa troglodytarum]|uniref:Uncharacterized protein n=1 Tax=Musa troglodytarum TaxID=320322 RepID=A0A9E7JEW2_9LILI|nr:hypothetical protein MUK42_22649 [Musa troglodytarum]
MSRRTHPNRAQFCNESGNNSDQINRENNVGERDYRAHLLAPAPGDGGAATGVGVGLGARAAVVVGGAATGAGDGVVAEGVVADVA